MSESIRAQLYDYERAHVDTLRASLAECTVLLKSNGDFPLSAPGQIAAYGSGVRNTVKGGTGSGEVNSRYFNNVETGLRNAGFTITSGSWLDAYEGKRAELRMHVILTFRAMAKILPYLAVLEEWVAVWLDAG